jgi:heme oxygenase
MQIVPPGESAGALLLAELRRATAAGHRAIETRLRLAQPMDRPRYHRVLQGFDSFLQTWEPRIDEALPPRLRPWLREGSRTAELTRDLRVLGVQRGEPAELALELASPGAALGSLYVMEGSALGAQVIAPRLAEHLGLHAHNGAAYFGAGGATAGRRWRQFRDLLDAEAAGPPQAGAACAAAVATFDALLAVFACLQDEPAAC